MVIAGTQSRIQAVIRRTRLMAPVLADVAPSTGAATLRERYGISAVPWTLVLDRQGRGVEILVGGKLRGDFDKALDRAEKDLATDP